MWPERQLLESGEASVRPVRASYYLRMVSRTAESEAKIDALDGNFDPGRSLRLTSRHWRDRHRERATYAQRYR